VRWDPEEADALGYRHHEMQVVVARAVRGAELLDPECLAVKRIRVTRHQVRRIVVVAEVRRGIPNRPGGLARCAY
jgi:hypothetical protein